jgi:hypothetical protein
MYRVGFLGLLLLLFVATSSAQSADLPCQGEWSSAELDPCLLPYAEDDARAAKTSDQPQLLLTAESSSIVKPESDALTGPIIALERPRPRFQWGAAIRQSAQLLAFQQGMMLATDKWARYSVSHGKFLKEYFAAVKGGLRQWDDGDPFLDNYIGHPLQGAVAGFVQVQNDPQGRMLTFGKSKAYWKSRMKAMGWIALYSTEFEIGPISEASIENLGGFVYQNCPTCKLTRGAGWVDIVVTPTLGTAWLVGEDALDRYLVRRIERKLGPGKWSNFFRVALNPARVAANVLRLKAPWYRDNRDTEMGPLN